MVSSEQFNHPYLPQTSTQIQNMLEIIGVSTIEELFSGIPEDMRFKKKLNIPNSHSEQETLTRVQKILSQNKPTDMNLSFLGAGIYHHYIPAVISSILSRSEFYTSYTPYAPEISQGMLQALWEYQSMISELTSLDIVNSSMYDMATSLGEAALMCTRVTRKMIFLVPNYLQPERFQTLKTYAQGPNISIKTFDYNIDRGTANLNSIKEEIDNHEGQISGIYLENPNFWGIIEENAFEIGKLAHDNDALFVVGVDPISLSKLKAPGDYGADIAIGEGQSLGLPMNFGGPLLGLFAVKNEINYIRAMPGRIIGLTTETKSDNRAFTMTLQTREQHIRREKATSNICTNNALSALASAVYLSLLGPKGLKELAETCMARTGYLMEEMDSIKGLKAPHFSGISFREFVYQLDPKISKKRFETYFSTHNINVGFALQPYFTNLNHCYLCTATEITMEEDIKDFVLKCRKFFTNVGGIENV